ncbi:hypothetical protein LZ30DRAFT_336552 [Colletotrichum cereale]|nr:hypothetical protein LZ30DRAFT_336552 [Colletotrichum cereale]
MVSRKRVYPGRGCREIRAQGRRKCLAQPCLLALLVRCCRFPLQVLSPSDPTMRVCMHVPPPPFLVRVAPSNPKGFARRHSNEVTGRWCR